MSEGLCDEGNTRDQLVTAAVPLLLRVTVVQRSGGVLCGVRRCLAAEVRSLCAWPGLISVR